MEVINNNFSIQRVLQLLRMEGRAYGKSYLWALIVIPGLSLVFVAISSISGNTNAPILWQMTHVMMTSLMILFLMFVYQRVHCRDIMAFSSIPATTGELMTYIVAIGLLYFGAFCLFMGMLMGLDALFSPENSVRWVDSFVKSEVKETRYAVYMYLLFLLILGTYCCIRFKNQLVIIAVTLIVPSVIFAIILAPFFDGSLNDDYLPLVSMIMNGVGSVLMLVAIYFALKKIQQKQ